MVRRPPQRSTALASLVAGALLAACGSPGASDAGADAGVFVPTETRALGLNDVTLLLPLEPLDAGTPWPAPEALLPLAVFERLTTVPGDVLTELRRLRVVAVRFDACDRSTGTPRNAKPQATRQHQRRLRRGLRAAAGTRTTQRTSAGHPRDRPP